MDDAHDAPEAEANNATATSSYNEPPDLPAVECGQAAQKSPEQVPLSKRQRVAPGSPDENQAANAAPSTQNRRHSVQSMASVPTPGSCSMTLPSPDMVSPVPLAYAHLLTSPHQINQMLDPLKPVWAALREALDSSGTTTLDAWLALDAAWTAMTGPNTAEESLTHMHHMASSLQCLATAPGWTKLNFPMGLSMAVMLHIQRETYLKTFCGKIRRGAEHLTAFNAIDDALYSFADTLEDLGPSLSISEVLKECQELSPRHWGALESGLHASVYALGSAKPVGRRRSIFTIAAWCNIAKIVVIIDSSRGMHTPTDKPKAKPELRSWHQLVSAMLSTGAEVSELFQPGHLAGADSPVHMACVDPVSQAEVVVWLVFIRFKKVLLGDAGLLGKALKALVTPELLPGFLVTARERCLFSCSLCFECPAELPKLVARFFYSLGWGQSAFSADTEDVAAKLMLSLLKNMCTEMPWRWQKANLDRVIGSMVRMLPGSKTLLNQALEQADFRLPQLLVTALIKSSVPLPRPLTYLAAVFDQYGLSVAELLFSFKADYVGHPKKYQSHWEDACQGLELRQSLPHFADAADRAWHVAMTSPVKPATLATWTLFMLEWVATFIQKCPALKRNSITVPAAAEVFKGHIRHMLPAGEEGLSQMLEHLSGAACAVQLHACQDCPAGRGFAVAFFDLLADSASPEQQNTFCRSVLDAWVSAQYYSAPSGWQQLNPFRSKGQTPLVPADCASTLCLCLMAFGPGRINQGTTLERCVAVTCNTTLFNICNTAAGLVPQHAGHTMYRDPIMYRARACAQILMPEHAELTTNTDPAIDNFLTAVKHIGDMLEWLNDQAHLSTGNLMQLSQLATALADMDGYSDDLVNVMLIEARSQQAECSDFLTFLGSHSAMQLQPVAQTAADLRRVVALQDKAAAQQIQQALARSQALFSTPENESFVRHFAARDSALFDAYLQQSWQHEIDVLLRAGEDEHELNEDPVDHPMAEPPAAVIPVATVAAASACIDRVLQAVHRNLSRLLTEDNLQLHLLEVARHHLAGRDEAAELQVVAEFFYPVSGAQGQQAVAAECSIRVQTRLNNIRDAIAVTQWADALPNILQAIQSYGLSSCQDDDFEAMQSLADDQLAPGTLSNLGFTEAASVLEEVVHCCGELSGPEKELFKKIKGCSAFWNFVKQEKFHGSEGSRRFDSQVSLVTGQLMSEVYDAGVLADVQQAQRIVASCLTATTFRGLLDNVRALRLDSKWSSQDSASSTLPAIACLEAVARNMELILNWFSNSGQQKIQTTALQLDQLLNSGKLLVKLPALADQEATISCTYMLSGMPHSSEQPMSSDSLQEFVNKLYLNWHQEQNPEAFDESIDMFLSCHKAVLEISAVLQQLCAAGHPRHQYTADDKVFGLSEGLPQLRQLASDLQQTLAKWQEQIEAVHLRFTHSEFLSTHQLVAASELLSAILAGGESARHCQMLQQLLMLVPGLADVSIASIRAALQRVATPALAAEAHMGHLEAAGALIQHLCQAETTQGMLQEQELGQRVVVTPDQAFPLHRLLLTLHAGRQIQPGQILWCSQRTSETDLNSFLKRVEHHSDSLRFSMVGLESLPVRLREQMMNFQLRISSEQLPVNVDYVLASGNEALLGTMSWMQVIRLRASDVLSPAASALQVRRPHSVQCFCGVAGSGKSHSMAKAAAEQAVKPTTISIGETSTAADIIKCLSEAAAEHSTNLHVQLMVSSYAHFPWLNQVFYQLLVEGALTDPATASVFAFLPYTRAVMHIEIPDAVAGEIVQETRPPFAELYPALSDAKYGMLLHLPVLADLVGSSPEARTSLRVIESESIAIDYTNFGPLVFPLLKLFFTPHPFGGERRLLDTTPSEANAVARYTGLQLYKDDLFFSLDSVQVSPEECEELLRQLHALVNIIVQESPHPFDRLGPLGSRLRMTSFMRHLHRRAAFFAGGMRDDLYQHFANIVLEIGIRECCQLANKSLRADWDAYPHSFLLYQEGHVQVVSLQDQMEPFCEEHVKSCDGRLQDVLRPYTQGNQQQAVHRRLIFTDAPHQYNTVGLREQLLAAALMGSSTKWAQVHAVLEAHGYILTLDYTMKMLHLEERRQSGVPTIMSSDTGVGKTKLLTVYHDLVSARNTARDSRHTALLGVLQDFITEHQEALLPADAEAAANPVLTAVMHRQQQPDAPALSVMDTLKQLREGGADSAGMHTLASQVAALLTFKGTSASKDALNRFLSAVLEFVQAQVAANTLLDKPQLAYILTALQSRAAGGDAMDQANALHKAYLIEPSQAAQQSTQACIDDLLLDHIAPEDLITPERAQANLNSLAGLLAVSSFSTFQAMQMHAKVNSADMWAKLKPFIRLAAASPQQLFTFFIDELNTSSMMGEMKSIFIDKSFEGVSLPSNIFWVAAINPARPESAPQQADGSQSFSSRYAVHPLPASMEEVVWAFGTMSRSQEKDYVTAKLQMVAAKWTGLLDFSPDTCRLLMRYITTAQGFIKSRLEEAAVSQRDLQRVFNLLAFFIQHHNQRRQELPLTVPTAHEAVVHRSLLLSIALVYYFRLSSQLRQEFLNEIGSLDAMGWQQQDEQVPCYDMAEVVEYELELYIKAAELPPGIAANQALRENFYCIAVCMETKTPLIIVGTPGNSKTLSFKLAADRLRGSSSSSKLFRLFHAIDLFHYQCSEQSTSQEIGTVCARALERQTRHTQLQQQSTATVLLDEGGLPGVSPALHGCLPCPYVVTDPELSLIDEKEALKIVHYLWDNAELAYVTISNRPLDAAKANRAVNVYRSEPSQQDLEMLASSFLSFSFDTHINTQQAQCIKACCTAYAELTTNQELNFGRRSGSSRDLHHFFKYLARRHRLGDRVEISTATVLEALQRNFGGLPASDFRQVVTAFLEHLRSACGRHKFPDPEPGQMRPTLEVVSASLEETGHNLLEQHATLSDKAARPKLVIDYTGDDSAYRLLFSAYHAASPILDKQRTRVFQMSAFKDDQSAEAQKHMIGDIRRAIECGDTCFLMYTEPIHGSLYDLFNQFFTVQRDRDQNAKLYVQIGIGSYSKPCVVHPEARIVVHTPARLLHTLQAPFLDRFEKYAVSVNSFWELLKAKQDAVSTRLLDDVLTKCQDLVSTVGSPAFHGAIPDSTVTTALLSVLQDSLPQNDQLLATVDHQTLVQELVRAVASRLLQIMKPHAFLLQTYAGVCLPPAYEDFYLHKQEHYNLKQLLSTILSTEALPSLAFQDGCTARTSSQQRAQAEAEAEIEAVSNEAETSAAAEARAAVGCQAQVLQQSPPQSKWVIFTNTTPDLDYILPAGRMSEAPEMLHRHTLLQSYVMDNPEALVVHRLEHLTSKSACTAAVDSSQNDISIEVTIFTANMRYVTQRQVSMLRHMIDDAQRAAFQGDSSKKWVLLLHSMPGAGMHDSYPTLFLYGWDFWYLDSCTGGVSQHEMLNMSSWVTSATAASRGHAVAAEQLQGEADVRYGHNTKPYLLSHLRPSAAAQQAAAQAAASLPAPLRSIADFYSSSNIDRRQEALDTLLHLLQEPLQQQYAGMWGPDAISVFVIKAAKSVSDGYHRNLSTALADMYQKHIGSFLAGLIHKLCGTNLDLITLLQAHQEWTASRPADTTMLKSFVSLCETRTVAELPTLMSQVNIISVPADGDYRSFRPAHEFPLFAQVNGTLSNLKDAAVLTLDMAQRSDGDLITAALDQLVAADAGIAAVQACVALDGNLRQRYAESVARFRLDVPSSWFSQHQHYGALVIGWLMHLWPDGTLASLHAQLQLHETQLAAGVMLLKQMAALGQQHPSQLSASLAQRELSPFIVNTLWNSLQAAAQQDNLQLPHARTLQQATQHIHCYNLTPSAKRYTLLAANKLLGNISDDELPRIHTALKAVHECGSQQGTASSVYISLLQLLPSLAVPDAAAQAAECLVLDLVRRIAKAQRLSDSQKTEIQSALHAVFSGGLPMGQHLQEYIVMELLTPDTLQAANRAKRNEVRTALGLFADQQDRPQRLPVLLRVCDAELTYLPVVYGHLRSEDRGTPAMLSFSDAMYTAQLRLLLAAKMPAAAGTDHDLPTLLADLHQWQPSSTTAPSRQLMDSITFCAHLHSTIAWLAFTLSSAVSEQHLQGALLHADDAGRQQQQLQSIFSEETHQHLLVAYLQQYCSGSVTDVLTTPTCRQGLGAWTQQWSDALRPHRQSAAQQHEVCGEEDYLALQQHFCAMIVAHATEGPEEADAEAANGAQQWLGVVEQAASRADACGLRKLKAQMVLLAYYGLFDEHRHSAALADVCPRVATALAMTPKEEFVLLFLAKLSSQQLNHVHHDTDMARMFDTTFQRLSTDDRMQRHFLVNLLAAIIQQPPDSSILQTHLFSPGRIRGSWPIGSTYNSPVGGAHYDCGVQFSEDHQLIGAQPPLQDPPSAHFVTLLSWGALTLGHMLFQDVHAGIYGPVMSQRGIDPRIAAPTDHAWLSTFMLMRVESCWRGLQLKAGLFGDMRMLLLNRALHEIVANNTATAADRHAFSSRQECAAMETALRDIFYAVYNDSSCQLDAQQTASELRQGFQQCKAEWPWTMHVPGAGMVHAQQPGLLDMLPVYIVSDPERCQSHRLLSAFLARRAEWEALKCIRPALHIYSWVHTALHGLVTQQQTLSASLYEFIQAYKQKNLAEGLRLERVWSDLKLWWNKFHALKGGFVADDCQPNSAFSPLSDATCLATFLGFNNEDNELVKVMKALMMLQNTFLEASQEYGVPESPQRIPVHLLMHTSMERCLLECNPFCFNSYIYAQASSDTAPVEFKLDRLSQQLSHSIASKHFIGNTILDMHKDFCYKPAEAQIHEQAEQAAGYVQLPPIFAVPLSTEQLTLLQTHCSHTQLEELQQSCSTLTTLCELAAQQAGPDSPQELLPTGFIGDATAMLSGRQGRDQQAPALHQRPGSSFFSQHGIQQLQLAHLQPIRDFLVEQYQQQGYQFADVSPLLKAPMQAEATSALRLCLSQGCTQSPESRQALADLVAALRASELEVLPSQANQNATLHSVCEAWAYEADEFPLSALDPNLACSQYAAVMRIMLQVLREQQGTAPAHVRVWTEEGCTNPAAPEAAEPLNPTLLRLPIWTDAVLQSVQDQQVPASQDAIAGSSAGIQLPQSITWQRIPEPMRVTALRLVFEGHAAADILQGMVCGLTITILGPDQEMAGGHQQDEIRKLHIAPASLVIQDHATLSVKFELPIGVDERVSLTAVGDDCGPGDAVYLASWSEQSTSQSFTDDAMETAYVLSHGDAVAGDACLIQVLLHQTEDADDQPSSPPGHNTQSAPNWLQNYGTQQTGDSEMLSSPDQSESGDAVMQDAAEQSAPQTAAHTPPAQSPFTVASSSDSQARLTPAAAPSVAAAMGPAEPSAKLDATTLSKLQKAGFQSREEAMTWLTGEGYAKNQEALQALGVTDSLTVALLQPRQLKGLSGLKLVVRNKMILILDKVISDSDRLQMVFQQHQGWLEEHLGMEVAGDAQLIFRDDLILNLEGGPLPDIARQVLVEAAAATADF